jgi:hypothetical protein
MNRQFTIIIILSLLFLSVKAQKDQSIDIRYVQAINYFYQTDSVRSFIKTKLNKGALKYKINDKLIKARTELFWKDLENQNISRTELHLIDSLSNNKIEISGLHSFSKDTSSIYRLEFSEINKNRLYGHLTSHQRFRELENGLIAVGGGRYLVFLFVFDDSNILERVVYHILDIE